MNLKDNQFLKIRITERGNLYFEIYEKLEWRRPMRWSIIVPRANIVNRHNKDSKWRLIYSTLANLTWAFLEEFHPEELRNILMQTNRTTKGNREEI